MSTPPRARPSCPHCFGTALHADGRTASGVRLELGDYGELLFRTPRGKLLPESFLSNVMCASCPLVLTVKSFRRVWSKAGSPQHFEPLPRNT